jgi:hypothetical protein
MARVATNSLSPGGDEHEGEHGSDRRKAPENLHQVIVLLGRAIIRAAAVAFPRYSEVDPERATAGAMS